MHAGVPKVDQKNKLEYQKCFKKKRNYIFQLKLVAQKKTNAKKKNILPQNFNVTSTN
jgi:hypothetical protein